jgi:deferrochelatase/peroxidase EfeB
MLRRGISFGPEVTEEEAMLQRSASEGKTRGLLFKCYVTSIEQQFEFVQQQWANAADFSQVGSGVDPIIGQPTGTPHPFLGAAPVSGNAEKKPQLNLKTFVHMEGGGYFFAPSIPALKALGAG